MARRLIVANCEIEAYQYGNYSISIIYSRLGKYMGIASYRNKICELTEWYETQAEAKDVIETLVGF